MTKIPDKLGTIFQRKLLEVHEDGLVKLGRRILGSLGQR